MPMLIGLLILVGTLYQLFFRYEHLPSKHEGVFYEHDSLTGETRRLKPGARASVFARILGESGGERVEWDSIASDIDGSAKRHISYDGLFDRIDPDEVSTAPVRLDGSLDETPAGKPNLKDASVVARMAKPIPVPKEVVVASSAPPVPAMGMLAADIDEPEESPRPFAIRQIDLNDDGKEEEVIQNAVHSDGLLDISIVKGGREIFFGRGKQVSLLPTRSGGWSDIALKTGKSGLKVFRYNAAQDFYKPLKI